VNDLDEARHAVEGVRAGYPPRVESPRVRVLVVDDEENLRHLLELILSRAGYAVVTCANGREALTRLREADIVLCDIRMPEMDGLAFLDARPADAPPVVMMSAYGTVETALEAIRRGAYDYVSKPFKADEIVLTLRKLQEREQLAAERSRRALENARLSMRLGEPVEGFVGHAPSIVELLRVLSRAANHDSSVLLTGESGTGKELLANALHRLSPRRDKPWVAVNCAAIPEPLLESELFGHRRGAFTGAVRDHAGLFEQADGGTLFLDEIGELPVALQAKLLRTLQEGTVRRIGGSGEVEVDVRIVAATAASLAAPRFREDLFYRVAVVHLQIPPLRERAEDIPLLVDHLLTGLCARMRLARPTVSDGAMRALVGHRWPGNVRQLENVLERALLVSDDELLDVNALPAEMASPDAGLVLGDTLSIPQRTAALERSLIREALKLHQGNKAAAARSLELSYKALLYKIRDYGLEGG
jgi:two-component system response regulator AtoC